MNHGDGSTNPLQAPFGPSDRRGLFIYRFMKMNQSPWVLIRRGQTGTNWDKLGKTLLLAVLVVFLWFLHQFSKPLLETLFIVVALKRARRL